ncbi:MAG: hypothetical protein FJX77_08755, partial [Armatimonadetes bacterium]|nr:hypothetical protein [Armatimonadota bacterium]
ASAAGGAVLFGVLPDGSRVGVQIGRGTLERLADQVKQHTEPPQYPAIQVEGNENSGIILVRVEESPVKPVCAFGQPYRRVGRTNQRLTLEEAYRLRQQTTGRTWDSLLCPGLTFRDLARQAVVEYLRRAGQPASTPTRTVLENLRLTAGEGLCYGAALLFARHPHRWVSGAQVRCGRFRGTTSVDFLDEQALEGVVLQQIEQALAFVSRNTRQAIRITGRPEREIVPEYPVEAVREAITNAVCHRDYTAAGTVQVRIYDDRLEVWNPGALPAELTIEALYREHPSLPRNRVLADALYRAGLIEQWGTGTLRIVRECAAAGLVRPEFRWEMGTFMVRFTGPGTEERPRREAHTEPAVEFARNHGRFTSRDYAALLGRTQRQAQRELAELVRRNLLARRGSGPVTFYELP